MSLQIAALVVAALSGLATPLYLALEAEPSAPLGEGIDAPLDELAQPSPAETTGARQAALPVPDDPRPAMEFDGLNTGESHYMFGDSITMAAKTAKAGNDNLPGSFSSPLWQARPPGVTVDVYKQGGGKGTCWAEQHLADVDPPPSLAAGQTFILEFHHNDWSSAKCGWTIEQTVAGNLRMHDRLVEQGVGQVRFANVLAKSGTDACNQEPLGEGEGQHLGLQRSRAAALRDMALQRGRVSLPMYDAVDRVPGNGVLDDADPALVYDCIHPTHEGNRRLGEFLWWFLLGHDHQVRPNVDGHVRVVANYTQVVPVPTAAGWGSAVQAYDLTSGAAVPVKAGAAGFVELATERGHQYLVGPAAHETGPGVG
jgi:hypothetical protein